VTTLPCQTIRTIRFNAIDRGPPQRVLTQKLGKLPLLLLKSDPQALLIAPTEESINDDSFTGFAAFAGGR
jgi:hypothetical protein